MIALFAVAAYLAFAILNVVFVATQVVVGRWIGATIREVSLGMGPTLMSGMWRNVQWRLKPLWIAGSTSYVGRENDDFDHSTFQGVYYEEIPKGSRALLMFLGPVSMIGFGGALLLIATLLPNGEVAVAADLVGNVTPSARPGLSVTGHPATFSSQVRLVQQAPLEFLLRLVTFDSLNGWGGLIGTFVTCGVAATHSLAAWISCVGALCAGVGIANLAPIPCLNGGHLLLLGFEVLFGRSERVLTTSTYIGFLLIISFYGRALLCDWRWLRATGLL